MRKKLLFLLLATTFVLNIYAQTFNPDEILIPDKKITLEQLPNGLTYYIRPNNYPEDEIQLLLVVKSGSMMETDDQQGLAHFFEHFSHLLLSEFISFEFITVNLKSHFPLSSKDVLISRFIVFLFIFK